MIQLSFLLHAVFRSNPLFELAEWGNLSRPEQDALAGLSANPDIFGIFRSKNNSGAIISKLAYKEVALLFYCLQQPGKLPVYFKNAYDDDVNSTLAKLVMEGIFEIESQGRFVSGTAAQGILYRQPVISQTTGASHTQQLSSKAIQYALQLNVADARSIASKLYCYNTIPALTGNNSLYDRMEDAEQFLDIRKNDSLGWEIGKNWNRHEPSSTYKWIAWSRNNHPIRTSNTAATCKLYISPLPAQMPEVFRKAVPVITKSGAFSFKTGKDKAGLLRPDKFVVYFYTYNQLAATAALLKEELAAYEAQGVPFTAPIDNAGMLSWGMDPPGEEVLENLEGGSWRSGIAEKIASAIVQAKAEGLSKEKSLEFILHKIALEGIDPFKWMPLQKEPALIG